MAWSWSHSTDAYVIANEQLNNKAQAADTGDSDAAEWLQVVWSEWVASNWRDDRVATDLDPKKYETALARAKRQGDDLGYDKLASDIWKWSSELAACTNGGHEAWTCPFGCHLLPFSNRVQ